MQLTASLFRALKIIAGVVYQGFAVITAKTLDRADQNHVIARIMTGDNPAIECCEIFLHHRRPCRPCLKPVFLDRVRQITGVIIGYSALVGPQNVNAIAIGRYKGGLGGRPVFETPEHQGRVQRNGRERVNRERPDNAIAVPAGSDGDSGCETAKGVLEGPVFIGHEVLSSRRIRPFPPGKRYIYVLWR